MLFDLFINSLNRLLAKAKELRVLRPIAHHEVVTSVSLYADDMVLFFHPDEGLRMVRTILTIFGNAFGLHINFAKCSMSPIACSDKESLEAVSVMECQLTPVPIKYLGILLTVGKLPASALQLLVDSIVDRLPCGRQA
jgi:hypothetical protein